MLSTSPTMGLLPAIKFLFGFATPLLLGIAGAMLYQKRPILGIHLLLAAWLILIGIAAPLMLSPPPPAWALDLIMLACNAGWFVAGLALVLLGFDHRVSEPLRIR